MLFLRMGKLEVTECVLSCNNGFQMCRFRFQRMQRNVCKSVFQSTSVSLLASILSCRGVCMHSGVCVCICVDVGLCMSVCCVCGTLWCKQFLN